ncbi:2Fe-2S iron-sulfur cluster-binding protein [Marinobacter nauticus]|uniref:2Fe-2S iron-sulfur cluster-binding protein n=1 Tax=Marinobacter nauticus TaxID=2743 RepID=UPI002430EB64|nr:2Fe-2S iron-sulfur cluster-binding protein [Marinobacter nauticus]
MGRITFIEHDGTEHVVDIEAGKSLMEAATENGVPGIDADCGGACACGTCHVMVEANWLPATGDMLATEAGMLSMTPEKTETSRLACQVTVSEAMDGMVVRLPEFQM